MSLWGACVGSALPVCFPTMEKPRATPVLLHVGEAAQILKVCKDSIYRMIDGPDKLPAIRVGKRRVLRIPYKRLLHWAGLTEKDL